MRKSRPDAVLKMLPAEEQEELFTFLKTHPCAEAVEWLAERGTHTQRYSVQKFFHWYPLSRQVTGAAEALATLRELLMENPELTGSGRQAAFAAQAVFELQALQAGDAKRHVALCRVRLEAEQAELQRSLLEQKVAAQRLAIVQFRERRAQERRRTALREQAEARAQARYRREECVLLMQWWEDGRGRKVPIGDGTFAEKMEALSRALFGDAWTTDATGSGGRRRMRSLPRRRRRRPSPPLSLPSRPPSPCLKPSLHPQPSPPRFRRRRGSPRRARLPSSRLRPKGLAPRRPREIAFPFSRPPP